MQASVLENQNVCGTDTKIKTVRFMVRKRKKPKMILNTIQVSYIVNSSPLCYKLLKVDVIKKTIFTSFLYVTNSLNST